MLLCILKLPFPDFSTTWMENNSSILWKGRFVYVFMVGSAQRVPLTWNALNLDQLKIFIFVEGGCKASKCFGIWWIDILGADGSLPGGGGGGGGANGGGGGGMLSISWIGSSSVGGKGFWKSEGDKDSCLVDICFFSSSSLDST